MPTPTPVLADTNITPTCPTGFSFSNGKCVASPSCPNGGSINTEGVCAVPPTCNFGTNSNGGCSDDPCPPNASFNGQTCTTSPTCPANASLNGGNCITIVPATCPNGEKAYDPDNGDCMVPATCPSGQQLWEGNACNTLGPPPCPSGYIWDNYAGGCLGPASCPIGTPASVDDYCDASPPSCPTGDSLNGVTCYSTTQATCSVGTLSGNSCVTAVCPSGTSYSGGNCVPSSTCLSNTTPSGSTCIANPACPADSNFLLDSASPSNSQCISNSSPTCPIGTSFDSATGLCKDVTTAAITPSPSSVIAGNSITYKVTVTDTSSNNPTPPTGNVFWYDGGAGGAFQGSLSSCTLSGFFPQTTCTISYVPSSTTPDGTVITITAVYQGDTMHSQSSGTTTLTVLKHPTATLITGPLLAFPGVPSTYTAAVTDTSTSNAIPPTGRVLWDDGGAGGVFQGFFHSCTLQSGIFPQNTCTISYMPPSTPGIYAITAAYQGDVSHSQSSGTATLTVLTPAEATQVLINSINSMNLDHGTTNSLDVKLAEVIRNLDDNNPHVAKYQLNAFLNEINAKCCNNPPGKPLTTAQANVITTDAQNIINGIP